MKKFRRRRALAVGTFNFLANLSQGLTMIAPSMPGQRFMQRWIWCFLAASMSVAASTLAPQGAQAKIHELEALYVFGDSYSDAGNSGLLTFGAFPPPPYAGGRVSNGPVAVEQLWTLFNPSAAPLQPSKVGGTNYAVNGATSGTDNQFSVNPEYASVRPFFANTSGYSQLEAFLTPPKSFQPQKTLFVFWLGGNDGLYWNLTLNTSGLGNTPGTIAGGPPLTEQTAAQMLDNAISNIAFGIEKLIGQGATNILAPNLLDFGKAPLYSSNPTQGALISGLVQAFNARLATKLTSIKAANPQVDLIAFDTYALFNRIRSQPASYGLTNINDRCLVDLVIVPACNPDQWFFWDGLHPTSTGHALIAQEFYNQVPGPLPLAGAAASFAWARRLRRRVVAGRKAATV
ncbi:MAG: SGNH/GDSL hydrolase family protein [Cyanobacteriota bacterium]